MGWLTTLRANVWAIAAGAAALFVALIYRAGQRGATDRAAARAAEAEQEGRARADAAAADAGRDGAVDRLRSGRF